MMPRVKPNTEFTLITHLSDPNNAAHSTSPQKDLECAELEPGDLNTLAPDQIQNQIRDVPVGRKKKQNIPDEDAHYHPRNKVDDGGFQGLLKQWEVRGVKVTRAAVYSLKNIPPELLGRIFYHYVGGAVFLPPSTVSNPWKLAHVSRHWRDVLWATPEVWRTVEIRLLWNCRTQGYDNTNRLANARHSFNDIICRSRSQLSLLVENYTVGPVLDLVFPLSHRFKSLNIFIVSYRTFVSLLELPAGSLPCLESICMDIFYEFSSKSPTLNISSPSLQTAAKLKRVDFTLKPINGPVIEFLDSLDPTVYMRLLPWSQLIHLGLTSLDIPWTVVHTFLSHCTSLVSCDITIHHVSDPVVAPLLIVVPHLDTFQLKQAGSIEWDKFLQPFQLPSLRILGIDHAPTPSQLMRSPRSILHPESITALILRSGCKLETLSIGKTNGERISNPVAFPNIDILLKASPTLKCLKGTILVPASVFTAVQYGHLDLPDLSDVTYHVQSDGLQAFLNLMRSHVVLLDHAPYIKFTGSIRRAFILCHTGRGYRLAYRLYRRSAWMYQLAGIHVEIVGIHVDGEEDDDSDDDSDGGYDTEDESDRISNISGYYNGNEGLEQGRGDTGEGKRTKSLLFEVGKHFGWLF